jgi:hypothetical protein
MTLHKRLTCPSSSSKRGSRSTREPLLFHWLEALFFCGRAFLLHPSESSFLALARSGQRTALSFRAGMENDGQFRGGRASGWKWRRSRGCGLSSHGRTWLYTMMPVSARIDPYTVCQLEFLPHDLSGWSNFVRGKMDTPTDAYNWRYRGGPWRRRRTTLARAGTARRTGRCQPVAHAVVAIVIVRQRRALLLPRRQAIRRARRSAVTLDNLVITTSFLKPIYTSAGFASNSCTASTGRARVTRSPREGAWLAAAFSSKANSAPLVWRRASR